MSLWSKEGIDKTKSDLEKRKDELGWEDRKPFIEEPGVYVLQVGPPVLRESKSGKGNDRIELPLYLDKEHEPVNRIFDFMNDTGAKILFEFLQRGFGYEITPIDSEDITDIGNSLIKQVKQFIGKKLKAAVRIKESLYTKNDVTKVYLFPEIWYVGKETEDLKMDNSKGKIPLSQSDKAKLAQLSSGEAPAPAEEKKKKKEETPPPPPAEKFPWD